MPQIINFENYHEVTAGKEHSKTPPAVISDSQNRSLTFNQAYQTTINILVHNNPQKTIFTLKEIAKQLSVGEEFIRRRVKSGKIKATYLGDKPFVNIVELARIITEGV